MFLALAEMRRAKVRFGLLVTAIALLSFLILFQQSIQNSLIRQFVGGVRNQNAPVLVFNTDGRRFPQSSSISAELAEKVAGTQGVGAVAPIYQGTYQVSAGGTTQATSVWGYTDPRLGGPQVLLSGRSPRSAGEVIANDVNSGDGFGLGSVVTVVPSGLELTVVGIAGGIGLNVLPTVFTTADTYLLVAKTRNPGATLDIPNLLGVRPASGTTVAQLVQRLDRADDRIDALAKNDAADLNPGIQSIRQSFTVILVLFGLVVPLVCGLFFLILTFQKAASLTLLRALGAPARRLVSALLVQVGIVLVAGLTIAVGGYALLTRGKTGSLQLQFEPGAVTFWVGLLIVLGVVSTLGSVRRVLEIDPIEATTGQGVGR